MIGSKRALLKTFPLLAAAFGMVACSGDSDSSSRRLSFELNSRQFFVEESLGTVQFSNGASLPVSLSVGSGAFRATDEGSNIFYTITDRGPTFPCSDSAEMIGQANFCDDNSGVVFVQPQYQPRIQKWKLSGVGTKLALEQQDTVFIEAGAQKASGLPNANSNGPEEVAFDPSGNQLLSTPNGIDPEALVKLENGRFWVADDYGPSLLLIDSDGTILRREVPAGRGADYTGAAYTVSESYLPSILSKRQNGRGISALALSPDNAFLYFVMAAPLANPGSAAAAESRIVRIGKLALNDDGTISSIDGEYLYRLDSPEQYARLFDGSGDLDNGELIDQSEIRVTEAAAVDTDYLVVVEQARSVSKYYKINLADAESILGTSWDDSNTSPSLEEQFLVAGVPFVPKHLGFDSLSMPLPSGIDPLGENVEALALLSANFVALINDNRYGLYGDTANRIAILPLGAFLVDNVPLQISMDYAESASIRRNDAQLNGGAAKAVASDSTNSQLFVLNGQTGGVDIVDVSEALSPVLNGTVDLSAAEADAAKTLGAATSIATGSGFLAVAIAADNPQDDGIAALYLLEDLSLVATYDVGPGPSAIVFDLLSSSLLVANEGLPSDDHSVNPEGSITQIDLSDGVDNVTINDIDFSEFNSGGSRADEVPAGLKPLAPGVTLAQDLEPGRISVTLDNDKAYVSLQSNNAVAVIDLETASVDALIDLGVKDFGEARNSLDVNDNGSITLQTWPGVVGLYQPYGLRTYQSGGSNFFVTANEGRARDFSGFSELLRASDLDGVVGPEIDPANPSAAAAGNDSQLGRLQVSSERGDTDGDGDIDQISAFGARSFSVRDAEGNLIYDSGNDLIRVTQTLLGNNANDRDTLSDEKGAQPKGLALVSSQERIYALITLNGVGGVAVYDITSPYGVQFVSYLNNRNFAASLSNETGDVGPEGLATFVVESVAYLAVANSATGNVRIFRLRTGTETETE
ncbi:MULTISPECIES: choice-of-anchor I family protein [Spongiibacter]|uniref:choice-of-anchor I family protein n=1 Tax=Spongiibacter TaxID=630749 RepID=UPI002357986F|nr:MULTISPECIES: choice-of-anchor I family protein [Spongiibacter]